MSMIEKINNYGIEQENLKNAQERQKAAKIEELKKEVQKLGPRISTLVEEGRACMQNKIPLTGSGWGCVETYDTHQFISNGWSHLTGFICRYDYIEGVGKAGGGACNYHLEITPQGEISCLTGDKVWVLEKFLKDFDTFETKFHEYVEKIINRE